jgi:hypothetical protein
MPLAPLQKVFLSGFGLGLAASALLFYIWHTETLLQLQQGWLVEQQQQQLQHQQQLNSAKTQLETIDLLMKSYSIMDGSEEQDMRAVMLRNQHLPLLLEVQQQAGVDVSDLIDPARPFNSAQLYAALLRMKKQLDRVNARQLLDQRLPSAQN